MRCEIFRYSYQGGSTTGFLISIFRYLDQGLIIKEYLDSNRPGKDYKGVPGVQYSDAHDQGGIIKG